MSFSTQSGNFWIHPHTSTTDIFNCRFAWSSLVFETSFSVVWAGVAQSVQWWAMGWTTGFRFPAGIEIFLFALGSRQVLGPIQPPIKWVPVARSRGVTRQVSKADHLHPSIGEVKNAWSYTSTPRCITFYKAKGQFYLFFTFLPFSVVSDSRFRTVITKSSNEILNQSKPFLVFIGITFS
jgi:hypothetical protein